MMMNISIIGLGWLGKPLGDALVNLGYVVKGSTTSNDKLSVLKEAGYDAYKVQMNESEVQGDIAELLAYSEVLILNTPPGLRRNPTSDYVGKIKQLVPFIERSSIKQVLFIGSTAVFADTESMHIITNNTMPNSEGVSGVQLATVEKLLMNNAHFKTTILRFAGLVDERRHPATMMSKRKQIPNPLAPVNLIHREDCIGVIQQIISQRKWGEVYNAAYPLHPTKQEYYTNICEQKKIANPDFNRTGVSKGKLIDGQKTAEELNYTYTHSIVNE
ncbi:cupin [Aquimarina agarilytica]|uniref:cupin n=1 Tax=Aquimarina agarilytica TaxID=1087449 RepID=UPI001E44C159|nr:cupin [Aquimarina agarilytica]